jgi:hypothetical protein
MNTIATSPKAKRILAGTAAAAYAASVLALAISGVALWRMYCEGFGCIGKGIAWFAWAAGFGVSLVLGYVARRTYQGAGYIGVRYLLAAQGVAGVALVIYWAAWRAA